MKRTLLALSLLAASSVVFAAGKDQSGATPQKDTEVVVCDGGATSGKAAVYNATDATNITSGAIFVQQSFTVQCSANTLMSFNEVNANLAVVASASAKGNTIFIGSSSGGAVTADPTTPKCSATTTCAAGDVTTGLTDAKTLATSTGAGTGT